MRIYYTSSPDGKILINNIEDTPNWKQIEEQHGQNIRWEYLKTFPFFFHSDETGINIYYTVFSDETGHNMMKVNNIQIGSEYDEEYFEECLKFLERADHRLWKLINLPVQEKVWESPFTINN